MRASGRHGLSNSRSTAVVRHASSLWESIWERNQQPSEQGYCRCGSRSRRDAFDLNGWSVPIAARDHVDTMSRTCASVSMTGAVPLRMCAQPSPPLLQAMSCSLCSCSSSLGHSRGGCNSADHVLLLDDPQRCNAGVWAVRKSQVAPETAS